MTRGPSGSPVVGAPPSVRARGVQSRRAAAPDSPALADECAADFGVYIHIPFCAHRCGYCDFASYSGIGGLIPEYVSAVLAEIAAARDAGLPAAGSLYIGGGTPTLLPTDLLGRLAAAVTLRPGAELTVEANPDTVTDEVAGALGGLGATRVSLGMQSVRPHLLRVLGRTHEPGSVPAAVARLRNAGIGQINLDLIYGIPGESAADWRGSLEAALSLEPDHISAYALTVEDGTPLGLAAKRGEVEVASEDDQAEKLSIACDLLGVAGFTRYEVSNWARPGAACRQNLLYWGCGEYRGFGAAAHSHLGGARFWNPRSPLEYAAALRTGALPDGFEPPSAVRCAEDRISLGMRRAAGIPAGWLRAAGRAEVAQLAVHGLVVEDQGRLLPTRRGLDLGLDVAARLILADERLPGGPAVSSAKEASA